MQLSWGPNIGETEAHIGLESCPRQIVERSSARREFTRRVLACSAGHQEWRAREATMGNVNPRLKSFAIGRVVK